MNPKVSVIVPIYNAEKYLDECIKSIINQTLNDIEIILIDDKSTDHSLNICYAYCEADQRIKVFSNENVGQGIERNFGISQAKGEYIAFLDADDSYEPQMLEILCKAAKREQADMVSGGYVDTYLNNIIAKHSLNPSVFDDSNAIHTAMADLIANEKKDGYKGCIAVWDSIFSREIIDRYKIKFLSERDIYSEDLLFKLDFMLHASKIVYCEEMLYKYRITDTSFTKEINTAILKRILRLHKILEEKFGTILEEYNLNTRIINRTFFSVRFNAKKAVKTKNPEAFFDELCKNKELSEILRKYRARTVKNWLFYILLKTKNDKLMYWILKSFFR